MTHAEAIQNAALLRKEAATLRDGARMFDRFGTRWIARYLLRRAEYKEWLASHVERAANALAEIRALRGAS